MTATLLTILAAWIATGAVLGYAYLQERARHQRTSRTLRYWQREATMPTPKLMRVK